MMQTTKTTIAIVAIATLTMVTSRQLGYPALEGIAKMTASSAFVAIALMLSAHSTRYGRLVLTGLIFSWFGDWFLAAATEAMFLYGLGCFLLAHVAYISAFASLGVNYRWAIFAIAPIAVLSIGTSLWLAPFVPEPMVMPVRIYTAVISLMVIFAAGARGSGAPLIIPVGALLFYFSDLSVAAGQFAQSDVPHYLWGLPFYFCGQVLLALSVGYSLSRFNK